MSKTKTAVTETVTSADVATVPAAVVKSGNAVNPNSIRQRVCGALKSGKTTAEITAMLQADFPNSAAAAKATKHIGWYRADLRKRGELPKVGATVQS